MTLTKTTTCKLRVMESQILDTSLEDRIPSAETRVVLAFGRAGAAGLFAREWRSEIGIFRPQKRKLYEIRIIAMVQMAPGDTIP